LDSLSQQKIVAFQKLCYSLHMAINDVAGGRVYHVGDILCEFLGHNFVSGLRTLKPRKPKKLFLENLVFSSPGLPQETVYFGLLYDSIRVEHLLWLYRYSLVVENGVVKHVNVEPDGKGLTCSLAPEILQQV